MKDFLILGYYGFGNSGDDVLLMSITEQLKECKQDVRLEILSKKPSETEKIYGIKASKRDNLVSLIRAISRCRVLLVGGGTLIQDSTSTKSLLYYLFVIRLAQLMGKKVMLYANGIGQIKKKNMHHTSKVLNRVDMITLRDTISKKELDRLGVRIPKVYITADAAFGLDNTKINPKKSHSGVPDNIRYCCVSVREHKTNTPDFVKTLASVCDYAVEKYNIYPVFMPFQSSRDREISMRIRNEMKNKSYIFDTQTDIYNVLSLISGAEFVIGMRLHSLIYSAICRTPSIGLSYDTKVDGFMDYIEQRRYFDSACIGYFSMVREIDECISDKNKIKREIDVTVQKMSELAAQNAQLAVELLREAK